MKFKENDRVRVRKIEGQMNRWFGKEGVIYKVWDQKPYDMLSVVIGKENITLFADEVEAASG